MRLRSFTASSMPVAMKMVREEMGSSAIIISSQNLGPRSVQVTAAIEVEDEPAPATNGKHAPKEMLEPETSEDASDLRFQMQNTLRFHNLPELFTAKIMQTVTDREFGSMAGLMRIGGRNDPDRLQRLAMEKLLGGYFSFNPLPFDKPGTRIMLVGAPGIGKTFTVAKMAAKLAMEKTPFSVVTTDNKRAGGVEQLKAYTDILETDLKVVTSKTELAQHIAGLPAYTHVLIDTAGCNAYENSEMKEISSFATLDGIEPVMVMAAGGDSLEAIDMAEPFAGLPIRRLLVTRADTARRFGGVLAAAAAHGLSFSNISASSSIVDTLQPADAASMAQLLLRYQLQS